MSTRANVIIKDSTSTLYFYRHSDGYPSGTGESLKEFVEGYKTRKMRLDAMQSAGWLVVEGYKEYLDGPATFKPSNDRFSGWKVGAYEPTDSLHVDVEYIYVIDLKTKLLTCLEPTANFWDETDLKNTKISSEMPPVSFEATSEDRGD